MRRTLLPLLAIGGLLAAPVVAEAPERSPRPVVRPILSATPSLLPTVADSPLAPQTSPRPADAPAVPPGGVALTALAPKAKVPEPEPVAVTPEETSPRSMKGAVCGDPGIQGVEIAPIPAEVKGCGLADGVSVSAIDGIGLSMAASIDCPTAQSLAHWVRKAVVPAVGRTGGGLQELQVAAHYACRPRNNQKGARISEHGKGHAIDISGLLLADGTVITVLDGWHQKRAGRILRAIHKAACGPFRTVLGPDGDRFHQDHIHLDTARTRKGSFCR